MVLEPGLRTLRASFFPGEVLSAVPSFLDLIYYYKWINYLCEIYNISLKLLPSFSSSQGLKKSTPKNVITSHLVIFCSVHKGFSCMR